MFPYIYTSLGEISTFTIFVVVGILFMFLFVHILLKKENALIEEAFIFPRIVFCGLFGFVFAILFDFIFKYFEFGILKIYGITFYGGLIGASLALYLLLRANKNKTNYNTQKWFNMLTPPFIVFHICGRIGCFFGGCCYGKYSQSIFTIAFPDNQKMGIFHHGLKCYPTQLFEAIALAIILIPVLNSKNKYKVYLTIYSIIRFNLEFLRGDDRGYFLDKLSPSQFISLVILVMLLLQKIINAPIFRRKK